MRLIVFTLIAFVLGFLASAYHREVTAPPTTPVAVVEEKKAPEPTKLSPAEQARVDAAKAGDDWHESR